MNFPINALYASHFDHARMGGQKSLLTLIEHLDRRKVRPFAIAPAEGELSDALRQLDCPTFIVPLEEVRRTYLWKRWLPEAKRFFRNVERVRALVKAHRIDVLHPDEASDVITCGYAKKGARAKLVYHVRLTVSTKLDRLGESLCDGFIGVSEDAKRRFSPRALVEGMACGAIGLGTDTSGLREAFADGNGIMVREKSPRDLADAIATLMRNADLRAYYRQKGIESVRARFDAKASARAVERFYEEML